MGRAPAKKGGKPGQFQPAAGTRRIVPMKDGSWTVHTPDGKAVRRRTAEELAGAIAAYDADDRTPGWYSAAAKELGLHDVLAQIEENGQ